MPSASYEQRALMNRWFGSPIDDGPPYKFLTARGWTERAGMWYKPTTSHTPSPYEVECLKFLRDEWDYDFDTVGFYPGV